ncbi:MAG: DUF4139 domain-containing protein [Chloroflexi bacterium]|nr:DUF4139 domain-containing protein [Chloroflexota bacterium]
MRKWAFGLLLLVVFVLSALQTAVTGAQDAVPRSDGVSITIYNQGTALVQDRRTFELQAGVNIINFTDVAAMIDPTSVSFTSLTDPTGTVVLEQNFVFDLVNSSALLARYLDEIIEVTLDDGTVLTGQLLSGRGGEIILRDADQQVLVIAIDSVRNMAFPNLPDGLITRPTLRWVVQSAQSGPQQVELTYLTGGMTWAADYTLLLATDNASLDLNGWITLTNTSGARFSDAQVKLVAGDVNRLPHDQGRMEAADSTIAIGAPAAPPVEQREFFEYQLYEIARPVTLGDNETKQVQFVSGADVPASTFFVYESSAPYYNYGYALVDQFYGQTGITDVLTYLEFTTAEDGGLGADLPAGRMRVYQADVDGAALLIGENRIDHTPQGEDVRLYLGNAFDLVGERTQTAYTLISQNVLQETYEILLRSRKDAQTVEIRVPEHLFRWSNWQILNSSQPYTQLDSNTIEFRVSVPPGGEVALSYTVQYSWP